MKKGKIINSQLQIDISLDEENDDKSDKDSMSGLSVSSSSSKGNEPIMNYIRFSCRVRVK